MEAEMMAGREEYYGKDKDSGLIKNHTSFTNNFRLQVCQNMINTAGCPMSTVSTSIKLVYINLFTREMTSASKF
jgi:hypothetical protein